MNIFVLHTERSIKCVLNVVFAFNFLLLCILQSTVKKRVSCCSVSLIAVDCMFWHSVFFVYCGGLN